MTHLSWPHSAGTPYRHIAQSHIESQIGVVERGTMCLLRQSGLPTSWWPYALRAFVISHNATKLLHDHGDSTPYELRFGEPFLGPLIPFGAQVSACYPEGSLGHMF